MTTNQEFYSRKNKPTVEETNVEKDNQVNIKQNINYFSKRELSKETNYNTEPNKPQCLQANNSEQKKTPKTMYLFKEPGCTKTIKYVQINLGFKTRQI